VAVVVRFPAQSETSSDECNYKESCFASQRKLQLNNRTKKKFAIITQIENAFYYKNELPRG